MPILTIDCVEDPSAPLPPRAAQRIADAAGEVLGTPAGRTWVLLRRISPTNYAENASPQPPAPLFVNLRMRQAPTGSAREQQVEQLTRAIAKAADRAPDQVHVLYEAAAAGQQAFGGRLV